MDKKPKKSDLFKHNTPEGYQGVVRYDSDLSDNFEKPGWFKRLDEAFDYVQKYRDVVPYYVKNCKSIINDAKVICKLKAEHKQIRQAHKMENMQKKKQKFTAQFTEFKTKLMEQVDGNNTHAVTPQVKEPKQSDTCSKTTTSGKSNLQSHVASAVSSNTLYSIPSNIVSNSFTKKTTSTVFEFESDKVFFPSFDVIGSLKLSRCIACGNLYNECYKVKYRNYCLHQVQDYIDSVEGTKICAQQARKVYDSAYMAQLKIDLLKKTSFHEAYSFVSQHWCMVRDSMVECIKMATGPFEDSKTSEYLLSKRRANVSECYLTKSG